MANSAGALPPHVDRILNDFVTAAQKAFAERLSSIVLFGSAAENRLRATSDVNLLVVLKAFEQPDVTALAPMLRLGRVAARLEVMFLLESEVAAAVECFAQKFADIVRRHRVLVGPDPFEGLAPSRGAEIQRLRQVLLNLQLRLRQGFAERVVQDEKLALLIADFSGPVRTCAAALTRLEGKGDFSPREALEKFADALGSAPSQVVRQLPAIRDGHAAETQDLAGAVFTILEIVEQLRFRAGSLA